MRKFGLVLVVVALGAVMFGCPRKGEELPVDAGSDVESSDVSAPADVTAVDAPAALTPDTEAGADVDGSDVGSDAAGTDAK